MIVAPHANIEDEEQDTIAMVRRDALRKRQWDSIADDDVVYINVCGMTYETLRTTLNRFPTTLLGNDKRRNFYFRKRQNDCYFDRHRESFEAILYYYQSGGILLRPDNIPMEVFETEVTFFDLGNDVITELRKGEGYSEEEEIELPKNKLQRKIWELFEVPESSVAARVMMFWCALVIILSVVIFCVDSLPGYGYALHNKEISCNFSSSGAPAAKCVHNYIEIMEKICVTWFTFEYIIRLISSPNKWVFVKSVLNVFDLAAILPYFIIIAVGRNATPLAMIRLLRCARILRVFKLSRHSTNLRLMGNTLRASFSELCMLAFFLMFGLIVFSSALYYLETEDNPHFFPSIPETFWYTLVTMTTVGYGDKVPTTSLGKVVGGICACSGVLMVAMVVPVIVTNFERYYKTRNDRKYKIYQDNRNNKEMTIVKCLLNNGKLDLRDEASRLNAPCLH